MKLDINTIFSQAYHISRCSSWKLSSNARIAWAFIILVRIQQGEKQKRCHPKSDYRLWQATHFSTKNPINKPAMNKRNLLIAAVFHFFTSSGKRQLKTSQVDSKLCQLQLSKYTTFKIHWRKMSNWLIPVHVTLRENSTWRQFQIQRGLLKVLCLLSRLLFWSMKMRPER